MLHGPLVVVLSLITNWCMRYALASKKAVDFNVICTKRGLLCSVEHV